MPSQSNTETLTIPVPSEGTMAGFLQRLEMRARFYNLEISGHRQHDPAARPVSLQVTVAGPRGKRSNFFNEFK